MKRLLLLILLCTTLVGCGSSRSTTTKRNSSSAAAVAVKRSERVVNHATSFIGTRYKYGGTTKKGMDCSGLVYTSFMKESIPLPRISRDMARSGSRISLKEVDKGDLVFFKTGKNRGDINHVGLVVGTDNNEILFIHSTTSKGVIISSMNETYWRNSFVEVRRVI